MSVLSSLPPPNETERAFVHDPPRGEDGHLKGGAELGEVVREVVSALAPPNGTGIPLSASRPAAVAGVGFLFGQSAKKNTCVWHAIPPSTH